MANELFVGAVVNCKTGKVGESQRGKWCLVKSVDAKGRNMVPLWISNEDHGVSDGDEGFSFRIDEIEKVSVKPKEYPKGSGTWTSETSLNVKGHKVGDANEIGIPDFTTGGFSTVDNTDELPF